MNIKFDKKKKKISDVNYGLSQTIVFLIYYI